MNYIFLTKSVNEANYINFINIKIYQSIDTIVIEKLLVYQAVKDIIEEKNSNEISLP